jgi:excinuclease ABC subunit A
LLLEEGSGIGGSRSGVMGVIEHNLDVIRCADWIIDLGPDGGDKGGEIVVVGTPETVAEHPTSHTGRYLKEVLEQHPPEAVAV